ncbi:CgeB family protein [Methylocapsa palsarum]|uniref:Spore maturation protein CgeB n=1 Tax=Methylocapsa palsarum TaxID=1612308 RepID=A0A1I4B0Y1_9HYPH|nr:glycosyltransferase [Methylocapsa palsarum]SFK62498.1 Spore maturation protein CgeB [Methylocapsa palsarum]
MNLLYVGLDGGTSGQRIAALRRLGHEVTVFDQYRAYPNNKFFRYWHIKTALLGFDWLVDRYMLSKLKGRSFDMVFVDHGDLISPKVVRAFKKAGKVVVNYNQDDPYSDRDGRRWRIFWRALPFYDLVVTTKNYRVEDALAKGARRVLAVRSPADEVIHRPVDLSADDLARFAADVVFVGTWMPERGPLLKRLAERGVPLRIYGERWHKAPEYDSLRSCVVLGNLEGELYTKAIRGASIALGLLSKGYGDLHTTRSVEIPAIGTLFCAERTADHMAMYKDGEEAVFWDDPDDCADKCLALLADPEKIRTIAAAGLARVRKNGDFNKVLLPKIIDEALGVRAEVSQLN